MADGVLRKGVPIPNVERRVGDPENITLDWETYTLSEVGSSGLGSTRVDLLSSY